MGTHDPLRSQLDACSGSCSGQLARECPSGVPASAWRSTGCRCRGSPDYHYYRCECIAYVLQCDVQFEGERDVCVAWPTDVWLLVRAGHAQNRDFAENTALHGELRMLDWKLRKFREHLAAKKDKGAQANGKTEKEAANAAKPAKKTKHSRK
jgi:hypothetical protein